MDVAEIIEGLSKLSPDELMMVQERVLDLADSYVIDPSPEFEAAIEEGLRSLREEPAVSIKEARRQVAIWSRTPPAKPEA